MESFSSVQALCMSAGVAYVSPAAVPELPPSAGPMGGSFERRVGESGWEGEGLRTGDFTPSSISMQRAASVSRKNFPAERRMFFARVLP